MNQLVYLKDIFQRCSRAERQSNTCVEKHTTLNSFGNISTNADGRSLSVDGGKKNSLTQWLVSFLL